MGVISETEGVLARDGKHPVETFVKAGGHTIPPMELDNRPLPTLRQLSFSAFERAPGI